MEVVLVSHKLRLVSRRLPLTFAITTININYTSDFHVVSNTANIFYTLLYLASETSGHFFLRFLLPPLFYSSNSMPLGVT